MWKRYCFTEVVAVQALIVVIVIIYSFLHAYDSL